MLFLKVSVAHLKPQKKQTKNISKMSLIPNAEQRIQCLMEKTTDKILLAELRKSIPRYFAFMNWAMWTRSKQKAFTEWLEYMEKCIEISNKYGRHITWDDDDDDEE